MVDTNPLNVPTIDTFSRWFNEFHFEMCYPPPPL